MHFQINRTDHKNRDFINLVNLLDVELAETDGDEHTFYAQFNGINTLDHVLVVYVEQEAIACGAFKEFDDHTVEIKRMYVKPKDRKLQIASQMLAQLELWAKELEYTRCILETGIRQGAAVGLYQKNMYQVINNYGQYKGIENSICFEKWL